MNAALNALKSRLSPSDQSLLPRGVGYSNAGIVLAKGKGVTRFNPGDHVACAGAGFASHAEYATIPVNLAVKVPDEILFKSACFTTLGAIAMQGIRRANVTFGETVVITGLGLLGLLAVQIAKAWGLLVIGVDVNVERLNLAKELGADFCFDASDIKLDQKITDITNSYGADAVIIYAATDKSEPVNKALELCRKKGRVVIVGSVGMNLQREAMYAKELDIVMSTSYGPGRYDKQYEIKGLDYPIGYVRWTENRNMMEFIRLLANSQVKVDPLISNIYSIDQAQEAYQSLLETGGKNIAAVFKYAHQDTQENLSRLNISVISPVKDKIKVGIIGAGSFIQKNHLANILGLQPQYELVAIAEKTSVSAASIKEKYKLHYVTTDFRDILNDPDIDLVIIGTRHNLHASMVSKSITAGKHVLVEKPLALSHEELQMVENAIKEHPNLIATVGFNRRYSSLTQKVRSWIIKNNTPVVINYRVNAGYIPIESWVQDLEEGGGRINGEVCHFIDLITYLTGETVKELNASIIPIDGTTIKSEDNIIVTLSLSNGSIGVITYTSVGSKDMEKERIEVFSNGSSMVISDFVELQTFNCEERNVKLKKSDKGHKALIEELAKRLRNEQSLLLPFEFDLTVTNITLSIIDEIHRQKTFS